MTTRIDTSILPESVKELVASGRYLKHRMETSIDLLKRHRDLVRKDRTLDGLGYQDTYDLIALLEDFQDRFSRLERKTYPEDFPKKNKTVIATIDPSSLAIDETFAALSIGSPPED